MLSSDAVNILELVAPPDNHVFHAGIWLSHDVDWRAVTDLLAPALTGVITAGRRQILETRAAVATDDPGLVVFHPGDRFTGGPVLPWAGERKVSGRRLHAKAALLQYRSIRGAVRTRVLVGSGNLTRAGLASNLEVLTWDEIQRGSRAFLGVDLLREIKRLAQELEPDSRTKEVLTALTGGLKTASPTGELMSSLTRQGRLVPERKHKDPAARAVYVVSPGFAGDNDRQAAAALASWCGPDTHVHLYTGFTGSKKRAGAATEGLVLSRGLVDGLRRTGAAVTVHAIPEQDEDGATRRLHAKAVAVESANGRAHLWSGSATCTGPGLLGKNRELMVHQVTTADRVRKLLESLEAVEYRGELTAPPPTQRADKVKPSPQVTVTFVIGSGNRVDGPTWTGTMIASADTPVRGVKVFYNGREVPMGEPVELEISPDRGSVEVRVGESTRIVQIEVHRPPAEEEFWQNLTPEKKIDRPDAELERLLDDLDRAGRGVATKTGTDTSGTARPSPVDGGFVIPLTQRLVLVARHRAALARWPREEVEKILDRYIDNRTETERKQGDGQEEIDAARSTVLAIHAAYRPEAETRSTKSQDPLLTELTAAVPAFDDALRSADDD